MATLHLYATKVHRLSKPNNHSHCSLQNYSFGTKQVVPNQVDFAASTFTPRACAVALIYRAALMSLVWWQKEGNEMDRHRKKFAERGMRRTVEVPGLLGHPVLRR